MFKVATSTLSVVIIITSLKLRPTFIVRRLMLVPRCVRCGLRNARLWRCLWLPERLCDPVLSSCYRINKLRSVCDLHDIRAWISGSFFVRGRQESRPTDLTSPETAFSCPLRRNQTETKRQTNNPWNNTLKPRYFPPQEVA